MEYISLILIHKQLKYQILNPFIHVQRKRGDIDNKIELILFMLIILTLNTTWELKPNTITYITPF